MRRVTGIGGVFFKVEEGEFGRFAWATDPEGHRLELWEPPEWAGVGWRGGLRGA